MKTNRLNWEYRTNASKLHYAVGEALRTEDSPFSRFKIYQEYPVNKICPEYPNSTHKFDWVVLDLAIVIEAHGRQHYTATSFGSDGNDIQDVFSNQKNRDDSKMQAAINAGFTYIVVSYDEEITPKLLWEKYKEAYNPKYAKIPSKTRNEHYHQLKLKAGKQYRKEQYQKQKESLKEFKKEKKDDLST